MHSYQLLLSCQTIDLSRYNSIDEVDPETRQQIERIFQKTIDEVWQETRKVDFQIHTRPAIGAFNQWVKGTELADWRNRVM